MRPLAFAAMVIAVGKLSAADLLFPAADAPARLRPEVTVGGKPPEAAWAAFLDTLFAHFDRNGDNALSPAEAARVFPLPAANRATVRPDFAALDADRNGKGSRTEFREFYRGRGFTPVVVTIRPAAADVLALGDAVFRHLDRDADGTLSAAELGQTAALLHRLDEDEDEVLTPAELLAAARPKPAPPAAGPKLTPRGSADQFTPTLRLPLGGGRPTLAGGGPFRLSADGSRLHVPGGVCLVAVSGADPAAGFRAAKGFYLAQFQAAARNGSAAQAAFADDPAASVLAGLFDPADRDGDGRLTEAELTAFFDLIEQGVGCRAVVTATDRGPNLFDRLDRDGDGRLDRTELADAARTLPGELAPSGPVAAAAVPASYRLAVGRGPISDGFGPIPFGTAAKPPPPDAKAPPAGPAWFRAQDRNGDGYLSPHEFVGRPDLFATLDADNDGRISPTEAGR